MPSENVAMGVTTGPVEVQREVVPSTLARAFSAAGGPCPEPCRSWDSAASSGIGCSGQTGLPSWTGSCQEFGMIGT